MREYPTELIAHIEAAKRDGFLSTKITHLRVSDEHFSFLVSLGYTLVQEGNILEVSWNRSPT